MILFVLEYGSVAKIIGLIIFLLNAISVSQAFFFFLRLICVSDRNGLPFSVSSFLIDPTPELVGQVGRVVGQFGGTVGRCELNFIQHYFINSNLRMYQESNMSE